MFVAEYVSSTALQVGKVTVTDGIMNIKCNANPSIHFCRTLKLVSCQRSLLFAYTITI